ncbi:jg1887, partial [Pararge aegeria aegeria]
TKKFSVPMAQEAIERYILLRQSWGIAFNQLDYMLPVMTEIIDLGYIFVSPYKDKLGRRVVIYRPGVFDPYKYTNQDMCRVMAMCYETLMEDEETQVRGLVHYADGSGVSFPHLTLFTPKEAVRIVKNGEMYTSFIIRILLPFRYIFVSPYKDKLGRRVVIYRPGVFDPYKYTNQDMCRVMAMCYETLMEDEETQVRGLVHYADGSGVSFPHLTLFTPKEAVRIVKNGEVRLIKVIGPYYYKLFIIIISLTTNHCTARMGRRQLCPRGKDKNVSSPTALSTLRALAHKWK